MSPSHTHRGCQQVRLFEVNVIGHKPFTIHESRDIRIHINKRAVNFISTSRGTNTSREMHRGRLKTRPRWRISSIDKTRADCNI